MARSLLLVCPSCERHVRIVDTACPFCRYALTPEMRDALALRPSTKRLGRAARYALGMGTLSLATACGNATITTNDSGANDAPDDVAQEGTIHPHYGLPADSGPPVDAAADGDASDAAQDITFLPPYGHPPLDGGADGATEDGFVSDGSVVPPYGLPGH